MLFIHNTAQWLDDVDPWSDQEALDLFEAVLFCRPQGLFHCALSADGGACYVMTAHGAAVLVLASLEARQAFMLELGSRNALAAPALNQVAQCRPHSTIKGIHESPAMASRFVEVPRCELNVAR